MIPFQEWLEKRLGAGATEAHQDAQAALDRLVGALTRSSDGSLPPLGPGYNYFREWLSASSRLCLPRAIGNRDLAAVAGLASPHREIALLMRLCGVQPGQLIQARWSDLTPVSPKLGIPVTSWTWRIPRAGHFPAQDVTLDATGREAFVSLAEFFNGTPVRHDDLVLRRDKGSAEPRALHQMWFSVRMAREQGALPPARYGRKQT